MSDDLLWLIFLGYLLAVLIILLWVVSLERKTTRMAVEMAEHMRREERRKRGFT